MSVAIPASRLVIAKIRHRVQPTDVDAFQVAHYSKYMNWYSDAVTAAFGTIGIGPRWFIGGKVEPRVGRLQIAYAAPARLNDEVTIEVLDFSLARSVLRVAMRCSIDGRLLSRARATIAFVEAVTGRLAAPPPEVVKALKGSFGESYRKSLFQEENNHDQG